MGSSSMKVHQFTRGFWEHEPSLTLNGCKRLRPLAPKLQLNNSTTTTSSNETSSTSSVTAALDLKSFIRADSGPRKAIGSLDQDSKRHAVQVEAQSGGTRWNPTQEQIGILEMLYKGGMRTPNAQQIEQITAQLSKYGKIEGKNVFYWFQNHKARERQKQKRSSLGLAHSPRTPPPFTPIIMDANVGGTERMVHDQEDNEQYYKRKHRSWQASEYYNCFEESNNNNLNSQNNMLCRSTELEGEADKTLELFPLHPEGR